MRIFVTSGAGAVVKLEKHDFGELWRGTLFMAFDAGCWQMGPGQRKTRFLVLGESKCRRTITPEVVAQLALIQIRRGGKLSLVFILVAVRAFRKLDPVQRVFAFGDMASIALHFGVLELQGVRRLGMLLHAKGRRLESRYCVA